MRMKTIKEIVGDRTRRLNVLLKKCTYEEAMDLLPKMKKVFTEMFKEDKMELEVLDMEDGFYWHSMDVMDAVTMRVYVRDGIYEREYY